MFRVTSWMRWARDCLLIALIAAGCAPARVNVLPPPLADEALEPARTPIRIALLWRGPVDLDLYVTDPALETVYFGNNPSGSGGKLEQDVQCRDVLDAPADRVRLESAVWENPKPGRYRVGVDFIDSCGKKTGEVGFRVVADAGGQRVEAVGALMAAKFQPIALEFDLPGEGGGQSADHPSTEEE